MNDNMFYGGFNPNIMPGPGPIYNPPYNNIDERISNIEATLKRLEARITRLESSYITNNDGDDNVYML